jgi:hypothetical protein
MYIPAKRVAEICEYVDQLQKNHFDNDYIRQLLPLAYQLNEQQTLDILANYKNLNHIADTYVAPEQHKIFAESMGLLQPIHPDLHHIDKAQYFKVYQLVSHHHNAKAVGYMERFGWDEATCELVKEDVKRQILDRQKQQEAKRMSNFVAAGVTVILALLAWTLLPILAVDTTSAYVVCGLLLALSVVFVIRGVTTHTKPADAYPTGKPKKAERPKAVISK